MFSYNSLRCLVLVLPLVFMFSGCENEKPKFQCRDDLGCVVLAPGEPLKIGVLQALSGKVANLGREQVRGFELALEDRDGQILGRKVAIQTEDTGCSPEGGANAVLKIIADPQHIAVFGTTCSGAAAAASKAVSAAGLVMISGNNSAPFLTSVGGKSAPDHHEGYFRTASNEENAGKAAATYAYNYLKVQKVAVINDGDIYTRGLTQGFCAAFEAMGGEIVLDTSVNKGDKEMAPVLTAVLNAGAGLLFFPLFQPEGNHILFQARKMTGFKNVVLMSNGALIDRSFLEAAEEKARGMYFVGPASPNGPGVAQLEEKYIAAYQETPSVFYYLSAYDAAGLLFLAIEAAAIEDSGNLVIGRRALRRAMYAMENVQGVTGLLNCDGFGDCARPVFNVLQLEDVAAGLDGLKSNVKFSFSPEKKE